MKRIIIKVIEGGLLLALTSCATKYTYQPAGGAGDYYTESESGRANPSDGMAPQLAASIWPRVVMNGSTTATIYQPQVDWWDGHQLIARNAVAVQSAGQPQPTYGVVTLQGITLVDKTKRIVSLDDIRILGGDFPSARQKNQDFLRMVRETFPKQLTGLSLERLEESFTAAPQALRAPAQPLNNNPPRIIFSTRPAILAYIDGPPAYRPVAGTGLQRVLNTRLLLLKNATGQLFLHILDGYMTAPKLDGPWTAADAPPAGAAEAERQAAAAGTPADLLTAQTNSPATQPSHLTKATAPDIYVSTKPAELILFDGEPDFAPIAGTHLLYVANTTGNVFKLLSDQQTYVLISGRWFRAPSLQGPWQFVPANLLPQDFADIPDESPKENVKASVPGTSQATEALLANSFPESTEVPRSTPMQNPQLDGPPRLAPVAGTPLFYVVNSGTPIVQVDEHSWYACQNGVWFAATSVAGPWTVASSVPAVIYSIPPTSPLHYLTYVQVYGATPQEVYEGYTPGYLGTEVEDGAVVYGTGYDYPPWVGDVWYGWPCTWGFGWGPCWTPWDDWCFDFGFGWGCGFGPFGWGRCHPPRPWWGPGRNWHHGGGQFGWRRGDTASTAGNVYARHNLPGNANSRLPAAARLADGSGRAYNSRTGRLAAGEGAGSPSVGRVMPSRAERSGNWGSGSAGAWQHGPHSPFSGFRNASNARGFRGGSSYGRASHGGWFGFMHESSGWRGGFAHGGGGWAGGGGGGGWGHGGGGGGGHGGGGHR